MIFFQIFRDLWAGATASAGRERAWWGGGYWIGSFPFWNDHRCRRSSGTRPPPAPLPLPSVASVGQGRDARGGRGPGVFWRVAAERSRRHDRRSCRRSAVAARCPPAAVSHMPRRVSTPGIVSGRPLPSGGDRGSSVVPQTSGCRAGSTETAASPAPWPLSGRSPSPPSLPKGATTPPAGSRRTTRGAAPSPVLVPSSRHPFCLVPTARRVIVPSSRRPSLLVLPARRVAPLGGRHRPTRLRTLARAAVSHGAFLVPTSQRCCSVRDRPTRRLPPLSPHPV